jgi:alpha-amylase
VVVTHDIPTNSPFRRLIFDRTDEQLAYAYLLGRDGGTPLVFDDGSRDANDGGRWAGAGMAPHLLAMIAFHNRLQGRPMQMLHADACTLVWRRGEDGIGAINKCAEDRSISIATHGRFRWFRTYRDSLERNHTLRIETGQVSLPLPARQARLWLVE